LATASARRFGASSTQDLRSGTTRSLWEWDANRTAEFVIERLRRGSIVCMHDGRPTAEPADVSAPTREGTVAAVGTILDAMSKRGLRSVTISELLLSE
jgi:peptidoglycan/xylan/chitin deacetylase (PgdA/CDA1 family)